MRCTNCGNEFNGMFCPFCGTKAEPQAQTANIRCSNCGSELNPNMKFCNNCGTSVGQYSNYQNNTTNNYYAQYNNQANVVKEKCTNCGADMNPGASVCMQCGFARGTGRNYCSKCGAHINPGAAVCINCGAPVNGGGTEQKSRLVVLLLAIFLGQLGVHNFYLGYITKAVIQLCVTVVFCWLLLPPLAMWIWAIVEGVSAYQGNLPDAKGMPLKE